MFSAKHSPSSGHSLLGGQLHILCIALCSSSLSFFVVVTYYDRGTLCLCLLFLFYTIINGLVAVDLSMNSLQLPDTQDNRLVMFYTIINGLVAVDLSTNSLQLPDTQDNRLIMLQKIMNGLAAVDFSDKLTPVTRYTSQLTHYAPEDHERPC